MEKTAVKDFAGNDIGCTLPDGTNLVFMEWVFTTDERDHLSRLLTEFECQAVDRFAKIAEELCRMERRIIDNPKHTDADIDKANAELRNLCLRVSKALKKVSTGRRPLTPCNKLDHELKGDKSPHTNEVAITLEYQKQTDAEWLGDAIRKATSARNALLDFVECFDGRASSSGARSGRPKADSTGFVKQLAKAYTLCFGSRVTRYSTTFQSVVQFALEAAGKDDAKDPTRKIKQALSSP